MDYGRFGKSSWENETSRRYRERSLAFKPRTDIIYVDGNRHRVNTYPSASDSPVSPFGRNHILLNASPKGMLKVSRRTDLPYLWAPRLISTDYSRPSTPQRCQSSMDLRKSVAYTSAEDIRYQTMRKAGSCDNILTRGQYLSPGPPPSESGVSVSDLESIFVDDDAQSQSSLSSFDRSFNFSEFDGESIHDRLNVINEDEAFENPQSESHTTGSAYDHLASGRVNPNVLTQELLRLKDERERRKKLRKSQDVKAYIENNFPNQRNLSSTSADSCFSQSLGDEMDGNSLHENYGQSARRRLNYSPGSPYSRSSSGIGHSRFTSVDTDFSITSTETTFIDNLPGSYEHDRDGIMRKGRTNSYKKYENRYSHGEKFSFDRTQNVSMNSGQLDYERKQNVNSNIQLSRSQNEYSQSDNEHLRKQSRYTSSPKNRKDVTHTEETVKFSDIDIQIDESLESKHDESNILDDVLNMSKHTINVTQNSDEWEENDSKIENSSSETVHLFSEQTSTISESRKTVIEKGENLEKNDSLEKVQLLQSRDFDSRDYSVGEAIDFRDKNIPENKYPTQSTVETIDSGDQNQELDDDSSISERKPDNSTDFHASINSQTLVAGRLTSGSDTSLFTRETSEGNIFNRRKKESYSLDTNRAERNDYLKPHGQSGLSTRVSEVIADDTSNQHKNSRHFIRNIDGSVSHSSDRDYTKTTVVTDSFIGHSLYSQHADIHNDGTVIGKLSQFNEENRENVDNESYYKLDVEKQGVRKETFIEENAVSSDGVDPSSLSEHQTDDVKNILSVKREPSVQYDESATVFNEENKLSGISRTVLKRECESRESQWATREWTRTDTVVTKHYYSNQDVLNEEKAHTNKPKQTVEKQFSEIHRELRQDRTSDEIKSNVQQQALIKENISVESDFTCQIQTDIEEKQNFVQDWIAEDSESNQFDNYSQKISHDSSVSGDVESENANRNQIGKKAHIEEKSSEIEEVRTDVQYWIVDNEYSSGYATYSRETKEQENISPGITSEYSSVEENTHRHGDRSIIRDNYSINDSDEDGKTEATDCQYGIIKENTNEHEERNTVEANKHSIDWTVKVDENEIRELKEETERGVDHIECFITTQPRQIKSPTSKVTTNTPFHLNNVELKRASCEIQDSQTSVNSEEISRNSEASASKSVVSRTYDSHSVEITHTAVTSIAVDYEHDITHSVTSDNIQANKDRENISLDENNSSAANYCNIIHGHQTITSDHISEANEVTKTSSGTGNEGINQGGVPSGSSDIDTLYEFSNTNREILTEEYKSSNIHESIDENSHKGISHHLPSTVPFIDRREHVISQSYETLIIPRSTITHQSCEISCSSSGSEIRNTVDLCDNSSTKEDYSRTDSASMEGRTGNFEEEVYDNLEDFKSVRKTGLKINLAKNPSSILTRNRMQTIGEYEEVNFSNRLEYATVQRPATPVDNTAFAQKDSTIPYNTLSQSQHRDVSRQSFVRNEQSSVFTSVETDNSASFDSKNYNFNASFSDVFSRPGFNMTGSPFFAPMHSSPYQHESSINYERNTNVRKELIPSTSYQSRTSTSNTMQYQNLILGEIGNENMGQTFQFGRRGPTSLEEEEEEEWERRKETVEIKEQGVSFSEVEANWDRSNESININDLSFISDSSSIYQTSCSAEITDYEESGYETKYQESELLNISCDSSSTYSAICTAEVNVDVADGTEQLSSTQNTIVLSPTSEVSDPESGYYTLPRAGHDTLRRQDTTEDMTSFLEEDNERTIYHDQMFGEIVGEHASIQLERALSTEDITSFVESRDPVESKTEPQTMVRTLSNRATVHHVDLQEDITRSSSDLEDLKQGNLSEIMTEGRTLHDAKIHEDPQSFATTQHLQDIVDFSEKLAAEFELFADESLEEDSTQLERVDNVDDTPISGSYKVDAVAEISSEDIEFDSFEVRNATKIVTTEVQYFNFVENVTNSFDFSHTSGQYTVEATAEISSDDIQFDYLNEVKNSMTENVHAMENSYGNLESANIGNMGSYEDESHAEIPESFHDDDVVKQATKVIKTETEYFNSTEDLTGCIEIEVEEETITKHEDQYTNKSENFTEYASRQMSAEDVATLRRLSVDQMRTVDGTVVHLPKVNSTEDITSFEKTTNITKLSDESSEFYTDLEQSSVRLISRNEKDYDEAMDRTEDESGQLLPFIDHTEHIVSQPYETITYSRHSATHYFDVSSFLSAHKHSRNLQIDEVTETDIAVKDFEKLDQDAAAIKNNYSEEEITTSIETTYIYNGSNVHYDEKILKTMQTSVAEAEEAEEEEEEELEEEGKEEVEESLSSIKTTYMHNIEYCNENIDSQLINQESYENQTKKDEELMSYQTETDERLIKDGNGKMTDIRLSSTMEISEGVQKIYRPCTESHSLERDTPRTETENAGRNITTANISDGGNIYYQSELNKSRNTQYDTRTTIETKTTTTTTTTIESRTWHEQNIRPSDNRSSLAEGEWENNVYTETKMVEKTSDYETNSQLQTTEDENWMSQTDYYDISSTSSQYEEEPSQTSAVQTRTEEEFKTNVTTNEDKIIHKESSQRSESSYTVDDYEINTHTRTIEDKLQEMISTEPSIDHTEQFESLVEKDHNKIQMFIIYQDFAQMRERARLKKELELLSEQCDHLENRNLENRTEKLLKINSFLDCFLQNLRITENLQEMKSKLENTKYVERVHFYQDNSYVYEQMQKFSDIIHDLDLHRDDDRLGTKLTYCLQFLKKNTLDAQFESLADFVCQESEKEDMELLQNHLCLVKDGNFGSRRLLKYLGRGFSSDMKTIWKPKIRNNLQSVCEDEESVFHLRNHKSSSKHSTSDKNCCEFHESDKSCSAQLELWSDCVQEDNSSSEKISRTAYIN